MPDEAANVEKFGELPREQESSVEKSAGDLGGPAVRRVAILGSVVDRTDASPPAYLRAFGGLGNFPPHAHMGD